MYGPLCGLVLGGATYMALMVSWANVHRDPAPLSFVGPVRTVVTAAEWGTRRRYRFTRRWSSFPDGKRYLTGLRYYMVTPDPWVPALDARFYWSRASLPRIPKAEADARWLELEALNRPTGWPGQCLHATVGKGAHGDRWISRDRRIAPCP